MSHPVFQRVCSTCFRTRRRRCAKKTHYTTVVAPATSWRLATSHLTAGGPDFRLVLFLRNPTKAP